MADSKDQSINIKIAGKTYPLKASSPEMEQYMRLASDAINQKLAAYDAKFVGRELVDKLAFVTLNEAISRISLQKKLSSLEEQVKKLSAQTSDYLKDIDEPSEPTAETTSSKEPGDSLPDGGPAQTGYLKCGGAQILSLRFPT